MATPKTTELGWRAARVLAVTALALLAARALAMPDDAYDAWGYHLPFAARLWGIVPRQSLELDNHLELLFRSYPLLAEWLEGGLWLIFGRVQAANLLGYLSLLGLIAVLAWRFAVPWPASVFALLSIPLVQIHATSAYIDLPANVTATIAVLMACRAFAFQIESQRLDFLLGLGASAIAADVKYTVLPVALLALIANAVAYLRWRGPDRSLVRIAVIAVAALAFSGFYLRNLMVWGDPLFPIRVFGLGRGTMLTDFEGPDALARVPGPLRWLMSVLGWSELDARRGYFNTDATSAVIGSPSFRMGGYFGPWVLANLVALALLVRRRRDRPARVAAGVVFVLGLVISLMPNAHQLRYGMCWMLALVALNLCLLRDAPAGWLYLPRYALAAAGTFAVVLALTRGYWLWPVRIDNAWGTFVGNTAKPAVLRRLRAGGRYCFVGPPGYVLPYAAELRNVAPYSIKSAADASQCGEREVVVLP